MIEHLLGLQARPPFSPYTGFWTRLAGFRQEHLATRWSTGGWCDRADARTVHLSRRPTRRSCARSPSRNLDTTCA